MTVARSVGELSDLPAGSVVRDSEDVMNCLDPYDLANALYSEGLKWSQATCSKTELGTRPVRLSEAVVIATVLRVGLDDLVSSEPIDAGWISHNAFILDRAYRSGVRSVIEAAQEILSIDPLEAP